MTQFQDEPLVYHAYGLNGRFVQTGGGIISAKILDFRLSESLKNTLSRILYSTKLSL